jgi:hypothetical protein
MAEARRYLCFLASAARSRALVFAVILLLPTPGRADFELPAAGQPEDFSGVVGAYRIEARAEPTEVIAEDPLTLTLRLTVTEPAYHPEKLKLPKQYWPKRLNLRASDRLQRDFHIDDLPEQDRRVNANTWEFSYRLRPRGVSVKSIPRIKFVYCKTKTGEPRSYETDMTSSITLKVKPRPAVNRVKDFVETSARIAENYPLATGQAVLKQEADDTLPALPFVLLLLAGPPLGCVAWYQAWKRLYPDAVRQAVRRRSRAARSALKALRTLSRDPSRADLGARVAAVLADYLHQRLDLAAAEPTPAETTTHLDKAGVPPSFVARFVALFQECDAARFSPISYADTQDLAREAAQLIRDLEAEPCLSPTC